MGKKRKKKVYTKPKKIKHIHKKEPMRIIRSINNPKCDLCENRLSVHYDRFSCSYCNLSFIKTN